MKKLFFTCLLFCISLYSNAQATDLVIENQKAGQLSNMISENDKKTVRNLKVSGPIDSRDLEFIGSLIRSYSLDGVLDLSECTIKKLKPLLSGDTKDSLRVYRIPKSASDVVSCAANLYVDTLYFECKVNFLNSQKIWWDEKNSVGKADIGHLYIGEGVDSIGNLMKDSGREWAGSCTSIKSVHLPSSLRYIGRDSFWGCGLNYCNFNDLINLEYIESSSGFNRGAIFDNCVLDTLVIPQKLTAFPLHTIGVKAPGGYVYIGKSTKSFPIRLSSTGSSIKRVSEGRTFYINQTTPPDFSTWFQKETVYVPKGAKKAYINAGWSDVEIIEMNPVEKVSISEHEIVFDKGQKHNLSVTITPEDADDKQIEWTSDNESVASVNKEGTVSAISSGQAIIYATSIATGIKNSCLVIVRKNVESITFENSEVILNSIGDSKQLVLVFSPTDATEKAVTWKSSNEQVCIVSASGIVTASGIGSAIITATTVDGGHTANCVVKVLQHVTGLSFEKNSISLKVGEKEQLKVEVKPDNADDKTVTLSSSNKQIASVDANGNVTALKAGEAWIKAVSVDNAEAKDSCKVTVTQPVTGITISQEAIKLTNIGENKQLEATVLPEDASNKEVKWKSSNESICMVANGKVIATGFGTAVVMVTTVDGGFMASSTVTVESENTSIESVEASVSDNPVYNMMGRKVTVLEKGRLYIRNGKKFIAK